MAWGRVGATLLIVTGAICEGCGEEGPTGRAEEPASCGDWGPLVGIGTSGEADYAALSVGDDVDIVHGPQGGWHIDLAGRVLGTASPDVVVHAELVVLSPVSGLGGRRVSGTQPPAGLRVLDYADCAGTFVGVHAMIDAQPDLTDREVVCALDGADVALVVTVSTLEGEASASLPLTAAIDADDAGCAALGSGA